MGKKKGNGNSERSSSVSRNALIKLNREIIDETDVTPTTYIERFERRFPSETPVNKETFSNAYSPSKRGVSWNTFWKIAYDLKRLFPFPEETTFGELADDPSKLPNGYAKIRIYDVSSLESGENLRDAVESGRDIADDNSSNVTPPRPSTNSNQTDQSGKLPDDQKPVEKLDLVNPSTIVEHRWEESTQNDLDSNWSTNHLGSAIRLVVAAGLRRWILWTALLLGGAFWVWYSNQVGDTPQSSPQEKEVVVFEVDSSSKFELARIQVTDGLEGMLNGGFRISEEDGNQFLYCPPGYLIWSPPSLMDKISSRVLAEEKSQDLVIVDKRNLPIRELIKWTARLAQRAEKEVGRSDLEKLAVLLTKNGIQSHSDLVSLFFAEIRSYAPQNQLNDWYAYSHKSVSDLALDWIDGTFVQDEVSHYFRVAKIAEVIGDDQAAFLLYSKALERASENSTPNLANAAHRLCLFWGTSPLMITPGNRDVMKAALFALKQDFLNESSHTRIGSIDVYFSTLTNFSNRKDSLRIAQGESSEFDSMLTKAIDLASESVASKSSARIFIANATSHIQFVISDNERRVALIYKVIPMLKPAAEAAEKQHENFLAAQIFNNAASVELDMGVRVQLFKRASDNARQANSPKMVRFYDLLALSTDCLSYQFIPKPIAASKFEELVEKIENYRDELEEYLKTGRSTRESRGLQQSYIEILQVMGVLAVSSVTVTDQVTVEDLRNSKEEAFSKAWVKYQRLINEMKKNNVDQIEIAQLTSGSLNMMHDRFFALTTSDEDRQLFVTHIIDAMQVLSKRRIGGDRVANCWGVCVKMLGRKPDARFSIEMKAVVDNMESWHILPGKVRAHSKELESIRLWLEVNSSSGG